MHSFLKLYFSLSNLIKKYSYGHIYLFGMHGALCFEELEKGFVFNVIICIIFIAPVINVLFHN